MEASPHQPWIDLLAAQRRFLGDVDSINFMNKLIAPILKDWEDGRMDLLQQISKEVRTETQTFLEPKGPEHYHEWRRHRHMLGKAEVFFRHNNIVSLVSRFDEFVSILLRAAIDQNKEEWLISTEKKLTYKQIFELQSIDAWKEGLAADEVERLMHGSHYEQIAYLDGKLKCGIIEKFSRMKEFLEVTERRNLFVHTGGVVSPQYLANCRKWDIQIPRDIKEGVQLDVPKEYLGSASKCLVELSLRLVQAAVRRLHPASYLDADRELQYQGIDFLDRNAWEMAERTFRFALEIGPRHRSKGPWLTHARIYLCTALKSAGKKFDRELEELDWGEMHPHYHLAVAVLQDRLDDVYKLMKSPAVLEELTEVDFTSSALFRGLRQNETFKRIFKEIFKKDFDPTVSNDGDSDANHGC